MKHLKKLAAAASVAASLAAPAAAFASVYTVAPGDTLSRISPSNWQTVCAHNGLANCNLIFPGQVLDIPDGQAAAPAITTASVGVPGLQTALNSAYVYGGNTPGAFDCSGLAQWLSAQRGRSVPRTSQGQISALPHIALSSALPGDIVAFNWDHVGVYLGDGKVVEALNPAQGIQIDTVQDAITYNGYFTTLAVR